jgi:hypothetical protein
LIFIFLIIQITNSMKKIIFASMLMLAVASVSYGQNEQGSKSAKIGVGVLGLGANATVEYAIKDNIGVGIYASYERTTAGYFLLNYSYNRIAVGPRVSYHFGELLKLDNKFDAYVSGGALLTYGTWGSDYTNIVGSSSGTIGFEVLGRVGGAYSLSDKMKFFGDVGLGGSAIQGGLVFTF